MLHSVSRYAWHMGAVFVVSVAGAQVRVNGNVTTAQTNVPFGAQAPVVTVPGALITVCAYPDDGGTPCGNTVPIFQDQARTIPLSQPIKADQAGRFGFWTAPGTISESFQNAQGKYLRTDVVTIGGSGAGGGATLPNSGIVFATSPTTSRAAVAGTDYPSIAQVNSAQSAANTANTNASSAQTAATAAQTAAANALPKTGGTLTGALSVNSGTCTLAVGTPTLCGQGNALQLSNNGEALSPVAKISDVTQAAPGSTIKASSYLTSASGPLQRIAAAIAANTGAQNIDASDLTGTQATSTPITIAGIRVILPTSAIWPITTSGSQCGITVGNRAILQGLGVGGEGNQMYLVPSSSATGGDSILCTDTSASLGSGGMYATIQNLTALNCVNANFSSCTGTTYTNGVIHLQNLVDQSFINHVTARNNSGIACVRENNTTGAAFDANQCYGSGGYPSGTPSLYDGGGTPLIWRGTNYGVVARGETYNAPGTGYPNMDILGTFSGTIQNGTFEGNGPRDSTMPMIRIANTTQGVSIVGGTAFQYCTNSLQCPAKYVVTNNSTARLSVSGMSVANGYQAQYINDAARGVIIAPPATAGQVGTPYDSGPEAAQFFNISTRTLGAQIFNRDIMVGGQPTSCSGRTTQLGCAWDYAKAQATATGFPQTLVLGAGIYDLDGQMTIAEGTPNVNIVGRGKSAFGGGTTIHEVSTISGAVVDYPYLSTFTLYWNNVHLEGFSVDAAGKAPMCFSVMATRDSDFEHLGCTGAIGTATLNRFGGFPAAQSNSPAGTVPDGNNGIGFQNVLNDFFVIKGGSTGPGAVLTTTVNGDGTLAISIGGNNDYGTYDGILTRPVYVKSPTPGVTACTGGSGYGTVTGRMLTSITQNFSGCTAPVIAVIADLTMADRCMDMAWTDSHVMNIVQNGCGRRAMSTRGSSQVHFYGIHPTGTFDGTQDWGENDYDHSELDSVYGDGFIFQYSGANAPTRVTNTSFYNGGNPNNPNAYTGQRQLSFPTFHNSYSGYTPIVKIDNQDCTASDGFNNCSNYVMRIGDGVTNGTLYVKDGYFGNYLETQYMHVYHDMNIDGNATFAGFSATTRIFNTASSAKGSETTIYPDKDITALDNSDGLNTISNINVPPGIDSTHTICRKFIARAPVVFDGTGNINLAAAFTTTTGHTYEFCLDVATTAGAAKWAPQF